MLGHDVVAVDTYPSRTVVRRLALLMRVTHRLLGPVDWVGANRKIRRAVLSRHYDVAWIDKGLTISPAALRAIRRADPACRIVGYSPDDMMNPGNQSRRFFQTLPQYDAFFTTKSYGVAELEALGCRRAMFVGNAFAPEVHRPLPVSDEERARLGGPAGFVGQWEPERGESVARLAESGIPVRVWGYTWERCVRTPPGLILENRPLWGDDYALALCAFDINLCFLRKANRDLQTQRSIEIPACGAFMLAERTDEHLALFREGVEAEFFSSDEELIRKARYYVDHPDERARIAAAGRRRCLESGYSNLDRMRQCVSRVFESA
jgi:hypothetical protein